MADKTIRVALVTGANRGIGLEVCRQLAERGFAVVLTARDADKARAAAEKLKSAGQVEPAVLDVSDARSIPQAAAEKVILPFAQQPSLCHISLRPQNPHFRGAG